MILPAMQTLIAPVAAKRAELAQLRDRTPGGYLYPALMRELADWLQGESATPAFPAHRRLVDIHPFSDGNGRTARLLMSLLLIRGGYPPIAIRPVDRPAYLTALQTPPDDEAFDRLLYDRLDATLGDLLIASRQELPGA